MPDSMNVWNEYPPELLVEADASRANAEAALLVAEPLDPDPYHVPLNILIKRWLARKRQG